MEDYELSNAIHHQRRLRFWYRGAVRTVEPHVFGLSEGAHVVLRGYEIPTENGSQEEGWHIYRVDEIQEFRETEQTFGSPRPGYMRNDPAMTKIYCEL